MNLEFNRNEDQLKQSLSEMCRKLDKIFEGGGKKSIEKQREKNKLTTRERIDYLTDQDKPFIEIGAFAGYEMYEEQGGCPAGGTVAGVGYVSGRQCVIVANDQTVKAGAWFPITGKKNLRLQEIAMENHLPIIYLVDSAGVFLPMQDEIFPDKEHFGRIFRNNARMSGMGITQIAAVMGPCVAGGAYLPIMSDETLMVEGNGSIYLAGPYLVKAAVGEDIDNETLGGAATHTEISGIADYKFKTELRSLFGALYQQDVLIEGTILKASMVLPGKDCAEQASEEEVAVATLRCLKASVPANLPGIVFLSGGQSDEAATAHLNAMNQLGHSPWPLSFSYGRAMQQAALRLWAQDMSGNHAAAQQTVYARARDNGLATLGEWMR